MRRFTLAAVALAALGLSGCVDGEQTFTLNPDGGGKVRIDVVMAPPGFLDIGPPAKDGLTVDAMRLKSLGAVLRGKGVAAWKDVSAGFAPDGRFKFAGTAYFDQLAAFEIKELGVGERNLALEPAPGGGLVFAPKRRGPGGSPVPEPEGPFTGPGRKTAAEYARMPDAELDRHILADRVQFQAARPLYRAFLGGVKLKNTFLLPGAAKDVVGYTADGAKLTRVMDGDKVLAAMDKMFGLSDAELRPLFRKAGALEAMVREAVGDLGGEKGKALVPAPGGPQFDYAAEVRAARAAYPALRKALGLPDEFWIPDGTPPPPGFGPPR